MKLSIKLSKIICNSTMQKSTLLKNFKNVLFLYILICNRDGVESLERLNQDYTSIKKKLLQYSQLSKESDQFENTQKLSNEEAIKQFSYAESVYYFQKDVISCNKFISKLDESELKVLTNCQEYLHNYLSDKILDSLQNICHFKFKIKNLLNLLRDLCEKNYHVRLDEVKKSSNNPSTRNTVTNYCNESFEHFEEQNKPVTFFQKIYSLLFKEKFKRSLHQK